MNNKTKNIFLWIGVLPGALLGAFLATFPLHWILYLTFVDGSIFSGVNIDPMEYTITPFVTALAFVVCGEYIAPKYKLTVSTILAFLYFVIFMLVLLLMPEATSFGMRGALAIIGLLIGVFISWKKSKRAVLIDPTPN